MSPACMENVRMDTTTITGRPVSQQLREWVDRWTTDQRCDREAVD